MLELISHPLWGAVGFGLGFLLAHRLQLGRDRRAEFNAAAAPVRVWIDQELANHLPLYNLPTDAELDAVRSTMGRGKGQRFKHHWDEMLRCYSEAFGPTTDAGQRPFVGTAEGLEHLRELRKMVEPRA